MRRLSAVNISLIKSYLWRLYTVTLRKNMKSLRRLILIVCSVFLVNTTSIVSYAACPISSSTSETASAEAREYYNMLPSGVRNAFESGGWHVEISDVVSVNYISALYGGFSLGGYVAGYTESYSKVIMLSDTDAGAAMNHEMGHFFDYTSGMISKSSTFGSIYLAECAAFDGGSNAYASSDVSEYFADAFREYVECAGYLKKTCPQTFAFIDGYVSGYGGTSTLAVTEYTRCDSHIVEMAAKEAANATAKAARSAAQKVLDSGAMVVGKNAPKVDAWLNRAKDTLDQIANDPDYGSKKAAELNEKIANTDWEQKGKDTADKINEKVSEWGKKAEETDWEQKGKDWADKVNNWLGGG